jgi:hypothetical protein
VYRHLPALPEYSTHTPISAAMLEICSGEVNQLNKKRTVEMEGGMLVKSS